jgi:hypothetical protein
MSESSMRPDAPGPAALGHPSGRPALPCESPPGPTRHAPPTGPCGADVRAILERVIGSADFSSSPQLAAFLRFIVETTLDGKADRIKAYTIGTDALGRDPGFDPQRDPIVRVEANRLRRALLAYYAAAGANDPIIIDIPRGRYVPTFRHRVTDHTAVAAPPARQRIWPQLIGGAAIVALICGVIAAAFVLTETEHPAPTSVSVDVAPVVVVEPIQAASTPTGPLAADLSRQLTDTLAHVQAITVVAAATTPSPQDAGSRPYAAAHAYHLTGLVESRPDETMNLTLRLVTDGVIAWTRTWRVTADDSSRVEAIAREAAFEVAGFFGIMHARSRAQPNRLSPGYRCLLAAADYVRNFDLSQHDSVRSCLELSVAQDPNFTIAFGMLAFIYEREYLFDLPLRSGDAPPLERSLQAAQRALTLNPNSVIGHLTLMENLYLRGDLTPAFAAGETAMSLNPIDPAISGLVGVRMVLGGETERGGALIKNAASRFGTNPIWLDFGLFCLAYLDGDMTTAARHANLEVNTVFPYGLAARALVAAAAGDHERATRTLNRLTTLYPGWSEPKKMLERFIRSPQIVDRLTRDLAAIPRS